MRRILWMLASGAAAAWATRTLVVYLREHGAFDAQGGSGDATAAAEAPSWPEPQTPAAEYVDEAAVGGGNGEANFH